MCVPQRRVTTLKVMYIALVTHKHAEKAKAERKNGRSPNWTKPKKKTERTRPNDYIYKRNKGKLIPLITKSGRIHSRNKAETKKAIKIAYQIIKSVL